MEADKEIWKDIEGYEGLYKVSSYGNVLSLKYCGSNRTHLLASNPDHKGYLMVYLSKRGKRKTAGGYIWRYEHLLGKIDDCDDFYKTWE